MMRHRLVTTNLKVNSPLSLAPTAVFVAKQPLDNCAGSVAFVRTADLGPSSSHAMSANARFDGQSRSIWGLPQFGSVSSMSTNLAKQQDAAFDEACTQSTGPTQSIAPRVPSRALNLRLQDRRFRHR